MRPRFSITATSTGNLYARVSLGGASYRFKVWGRR